MKYISGFFKLIVGLGAMVIGIFGLYQYFGGDEQQLSKMEKLKSEGQTTIALIDTTVIEITIKGLRINQLHYTFDVDGKSFKGTHTFKHYDELDSLTGFVTYLPADPKISSLNIDSELAKARKEVEDNKSSKAGLIIGILLLLFGLFNFYGAYRRFKRDETPSRITPPPVPPTLPRYRDSDFV